MPLVYFDDIRLNAVVTGPDTGAGVVLIHALGTDLSIWDDVIARLPAGLRVLRMDLRGHGGSDVPPPPYAMGALIRDVERLMDHFALRDAVVLGVSLGGLIAQGLAIKRLDLVRALVLSNTAARIGTPELWARRIVEVQTSGLQAYAPGAMERMFGRDWRSAPAMPRIRDILTRTDPDGWVGCASAIAGTDLYTPTAGLTLPTLVIAGSRDGTTPPDLVRETSDLIRGSRFVLLRNAGHLPMVDSSEAFSEQVSGFLAAIAHMTPLSPHRSNHR
jgi:3-oxoadipate enol-lactonase